MNKHSPLPWTVRPHLPDAHFEVVADANDNTVGTATLPENAALIVEAVNGRDRDEALIASLLYHHLEDFAEAVASDNFTKVVKAAFKRLGLKYEPFGPDALETVEQRMKEGGAE